MRRWRCILGALACAAILAAILPLSVAQAASGPGSAVVLVSGFDTVTPFTTPDPACSGKEGPGWDPPAGVAATLKAAGFKVFTAPVKQADGQPATPCAPGTPLPPVASTYINSNGDLNANGQALGRFLAFLRDNYGITRVDLVAHSNGGQWSRSAITQQWNFAGLGVSSLTTLGTPYTGSLIADLSAYVHDGECQASNRVVQLVCVSLQRVVNAVVRALGETAVQQLTSAYLTTWNPEQKIGSCPVTGIAGTYFNLPLPRFLLPAYYNPSDGLVGEASALGQASKTITGIAIPPPGIPNFINGGEFPVVHGSSFAFLTSANLLNQAAVSNAVVSALNSQPSGAPTCTAPTPPPPTAPTDGLAQVTASLHSFAVPRHRVLPRTRRGDLILSSGSARLICRGRAQRSFAFPDRPNLRLTLPRCNAPVRARGRGLVLLMRTRGSTSIGIRARTVVVHVHGVSPRRVVLELERGERFRRVRLTRSGRGVLPSGAGSTTLRVTVIPVRGARLVGVATVSR